MVFKTPSKLRACWLLCACLCALSPALAQPVDSAVASCLRAWGKHPFGSRPTYKVLATSVKVFGIGRNTVDSDVTSTPALILVNPGVNVAGGSVVELLNPNGWYCLKTTVNVLGGLTIKAQCKAQLATTSGDVAVLGSNSGGNKAVTVLGSTQVERVGCE